MVGHHDVGLEIVMTQLLRRTVNPFDHQAGDLFALEPEGPGAGGVQVTIDPDEGLPRAQVVRSRETGSRNAPVQVPGEKQRPTFRILMRKTPPLHGVLGRSLSRQTLVAHALLRAVSPLLATCLPSARLYGYREHSGRALQTPRPPRSRRNRCRHEWRHGTLKACATSGDTAPGESVLLALAELFRPILHHADHFLCPGRVFDRRGDDEALPVG